jgi:hypothetical protein
MVLEIAAGRLSRAAKVLFFGANVRLVSVGSVDRGSFATLAAIRRASSLVK